MTKDDILQLYFQASTETPEGKECREPDVLLLRFAELVAEAEREACAKETEKWDSMRWSGAPGAIRRRVKK